MRLPQRFYRLPVRFDVGRLQAEVAALPASAWVAHPNGDPGNTALRLISVDGAENDEVNGVMRMTPALEASPYLRQVLAGFGVVWSRSRLLRLAPGAEVRAHADIHYHWFYRVRLHIPVLTLPAVKFSCDGEAVHMAAGEAWIFDNWRVHRVENPTDRERIHLVADTSGSAAFWELAAQGARPGGAPVLRPFEPTLEARPLTENARLRPVMNPAEVDLLILDLRAELEADGDAATQRARLGRYHALLLAFGRDWRQLYLRHGEDPAGWEAFARLRDATRAESQAHGVGLTLKANRSAAHRVLEARVLKPCLAPPVA